MTRGTPRVRRDRLKAVHSARALRPASSLSRITVLHSLTHVSSFGLHGAFSLPNDALVYRLGG